MPEDITDVTNSSDYIEPVKAPAKPEQPKLTAVDFFRPMQFSADDVQSTMGVGTDHITKDLLIAASKKLLSISKGETYGDDRDSLEHQRVYGVTEYLPEHIQRDGGRVARQMLWKATQRGNLSWIPSGALNDHVDSVFNESLLAKYIDGSNPFEAIDNNTGVTRIGEGGVGNQRMAPDEMRDVHNSFLGYIDPLRCFSERHFIECREGWVNVRNITEKSEIALWSHDGLIRYARPTKIHKYETHSDLYGYDDGKVAYEVTGNHRMIYREPGKNTWEVAYARDIHGKAVEVPDPRAFGMYFKLAPKKFHRVPFAGTVYCVSVPGEQIVTKIPGRFAFATMNSPESLRVGLDVYLSKNTRKGSDGRLYTRATGARTGEERWVDSVTLAKSNVATAEFAPGGAFEDDKVVPIPRGKDAAISYVPRKDIDFYITRTDEMLSLAANNVPMASASREMRTLMGCLHPATVLLVVRKGEPMEVIASKYRWKVGDKMYCISRASEITLEPVLGVHTVQNKEPMYSVSTGKYSAIVTATHKWMISRKGTVMLVTTESLMEGDRIPCSPITGKGPQFPAQWLPVTYVTKLRSKCSTVYDIDVNDKQYFLANGMSTHNSKYLPQSVPVDHREAPLVSTVDPDTGERIEKQIGNMLGVRRAKAPGVVTSVRKDRIDVRYDDGTKGSYELYQDFPMNQKGFMNSEPQVKAGDKFNKGDLLATSNYTDKEGNSAAGTNLRGAYLPWKGLNYEDAYVVSESAAKNKLSSSVMYKTKTELAPNISTSKNSYTMWKPGQYSKDQLDKLDDMGVIKPGMQVMPGDPLVLGMRYEKPAPGSFKKAIITDISETWDHDEPGIVTDAIRTRTGVRVNVKVSQPAQVGDKITGRYGSKGVISAVLPDSQMPQDEKGNAFDIIFPPLGIISRTNTQMLYEPLLGKIAQKIGKPILVPEFMKENMDEYVQKLAKEYNVSETETVIDPETGRRIKDVGTGPMYFYKLKHLSESKEGARGTAKYSIDDVPSRGGYEGCFFGSQKVMTIEGEIPIEDIVRHKMDTMALTHNGQEWTFDRITDWFTYMARKCDLIKIRCKGLSESTLSIESVNNEIICTKNHMMYLWDGSCKTAGELHKGDKLAQWSYVDNVIGAVEIDSIVPYSKSPATVPVYDITVDITHKYTLSGGILVSNSKRISNMESQALVGHNAFNVLKDSKLIRGQANSEFWRSIQTGTTPAMPGEPTVYKKFFSHLKGAGINVKRTDTGIQIFPLTDNGAKELTGSRELNSTDTFTAKDYQPIQGGLFGKDLFGQDWDEWAYIQLDEPLPNPIMEDPIRRIFRLTQKQFEGIVSGKETINGETGGKAIYNALKNLNVPLEAAKALQEYKEASKSKKDDALKRYVALEQMNRNGVPAEQYMLTRIPVLPPKFRPIMQPQGITMVADSNYLYKQMLDTRNDLRDAKDLPEEYQQEARSNLYRAWKELAGLYEPTDPKLKNKKVRGLLGWVLGKSAKTSAYQQKMLTSTVDLSSRAVIVPDPTLTLNEVGIPMTVALEQYKPFVVRSLVQANYTPQQALEMVEKEGEKSPLVVEHTKRAMAQRPLLLNRAPTLHKLSIMAFQPKITAGHVFRINPSIVGVYGADFDGNCCDFDSEIFVKISKSALDKMASTCYSITNLKQREVDMKVVEDAVTTVSNQGYAAKIKIGEFPRCGEPVKDKNGADVYQVPEGVTTLSMDKDGNPVWSPVTHLTVEDNCPTVEVTIGNRSVIVSTNESLAVFDPATGALTKVAPSKEEQRMIPVLIKDPTPFGTYGDRDLGWWVGSFLSDGWCDEHYVGYCKEEDCKRDEFVKITRSHFTENFYAHTYAGSPTTETGKLGTSMKVHLNGEELAKMVVAMNLYAKDKMDMEGRSALYKTIPPNMLLCGTEEFFWGVLSGLLDGDGSIVKNTSLSKPRFTTRISTSSKYLRDTCCALLYRLGINYSITVVPPRGWSKESYVVMPSTVDMYRNLDKLTCVGYKEKKTIEEWRRYAPADTKDLVPLTKEEHKKLIKLVPCSKDSGLYSGLSKTRNVGPRVNRGSLERHMDVIEKNLPELAKRIRNKTTHWYIITDIKDAGTRQVFDLAVQDTKVFAVNNGLIIWDTMVAHVPVSEEAVKEAYAKMLPSENLIRLRNRKITYPVEKEYLEGLYFASRKKDAKGLVKRFNTLKEAKEAYRDGTIDIDTPIEILEK